jgi:hypothetical protein
MLAVRPTTRSLRETLNRYRSATVADAVVKRWVPTWRFFYPPGAPGPRTQYTLFEKVPEKPEPPPHCHPSELLSTAAAYRIGMIVPSPLAGRIDLIVELANAAGLRTTRLELVAAAILAAPTDRTRLARQLHAYWHGTAADAVIAKQPTAPIFKRPAVRRPARARRARNTDRGKLPDPTPERALGKGVPPS